MGDRAVVGFARDTNTHKKETLFLYSHWGGSTIQQDVAAALLHAYPRWTDPAYATRMATSYIFGPDAHKTETGFGLDVGRFPVPDYDDITVVHWREQEVWVRSESTYEKVVSIPFAGFIHRYLPASMWAPGVSMLGIEGVAT
jgi:hypothetical protein